MLDEDFPCDVCGTEKSEWDEASKMFLCVLCSRREPTERFDLALRRITREM